MAVAAARHGRRVALISRAGDDPFGRYLRRELGASASTPVSSPTDPALKTPVTFCEIFPPDDFPLYFYREPKAPDLNRRGELDLTPRCDAHLLGDVTGLSQKPSRAAHHAA